MFSVGQMVKIDPKVFGTDTPDPAQLFGTLGYPGVLKHALLEVTRSFKDSHRGDMLAVVIKNAPDLARYVPGCKEVRYKGELLVFPDDMVRASIRIDLDYVINKPDNSQIVARLFEERNLLKSQGKSKSHPEMTANWRAIRIARGEVKGTLDTNDTADVYLPKQKITLKVLLTELPKDDKPDTILNFKYSLASRLSTIRKQRAILKSETKKIGIVDTEVVGGVRLKSNVVSDAWTETLKLAFDTPKVPTDAKATYVGIEIEMVYRGDREELKRQLAEQRLHKNVTIARDDSVRACHNNSGYQGVELQVLCKVEEVNSVMAKLQKVFDNPLIDAYANRSCGLHVHVDMRNRDLALVYKNFVRTQSLLRGSQPFGRVNNIHCKVNESETFNFKKVINREDRYWVINGHAFNEHKTLEIRTHEGTVNTSEIVKWVEFVNAIASYDKEIPKSGFKLSRDLVAETGLTISSAAIEYIDSRIERFRSVV